MNKTTRQKAIDLLIERDIEAMSSGSMYDLFFYGMVGYEVIEDSEIIDMLNEIDYIRRCHLCYGPEIDKYCINESCAEYK